MKEAVILAQGAYPTHPYPLHILHTAKMLICTDGAVNTLKDRIPDRIVGDLDSLTPSLREKYASRLIEDSCKETNDLTKAILYCHKEGIRAITILGATGRREDHTLGNISLLGSYAIMMESVRMVTDYGVFMVFAHGRTDQKGFRHVSVPCVPGEPVSFFALNPAMKLCAKGVRYPVEQVVFDAWWKATLNQCTEKKLELSFRDGPLLVYLTHPNP
ncbi:MAG: thiamine diphosphokinase [Bacteroidales bacterium]|jgi:thiamine pyrophosphokinase|nr:thiamine diphosphokinase [Bacteroidales bacterium]MDD2263620.1 thiamine diphosphokinase [Bacteroidales bacterium]MDD2830589.1 thiamine diphosphokinase [Bacteroidales bacterium]MDD3208858.1 thiamine diphosphokinase [Bacteroidales bacterium]MDD3697417.1 thiamine diphosphokinase [Bacteroidales bacterium]